MDFLHTVHITGSRFGKKYIYINIYIRRASTGLQFNASVSKEKHYNVNCTAYADLCNSNPELPNSCMAITG